MAVNTMNKLGRASALALMAATLALPGMAQARPDEEGGWVGRGAERTERVNNGGGRQGGNGGASNGGGQSSWGGRGDNGGGQSGWTAPQAAPPVVNQPAPRWNGNADAGRWNGNRDGNRDANRSGGSWNGGNWNGNRSGGNWSGQPVPTPPPVVNAPAQPQNWNGGTWQNRDANRDRTRDGNREHWNGNTGGTWQNRDGNRERDRDRDGDRWRSSTGTVGWRSGTDGWRDHDRDRDNNRWRGNTWNGSHYSNGYNNNRDYRRWDNRWRDNRRYDWNSYRRYNPSIFRMGMYYAPYRGYSYRRIGIGFFLDNLFFSSRYWINNPWDYRLPDVYGPYRWVRYYDDALLVDVRSGEVVDVINNFFW